MHIDNKPFADMHAAGTKIYKGNIIHCVKEFTVQNLDGFVIVENEKILAIDEISVFDKYRSQFDLSNAEEINLGPSQILLPGLIDTHIHASQYPNAGLGMNKSLLDWLSRYTFPIERKFKDDEFAKKVYNAVVKRTISYGTTTACYFATLFGETTLHLADAAIKYGQRAFVGKVNMTRCAPIDYLETSEENLTNTRKFVTEVLAKKSPLVKPVITPRFAISLEDEDMRKLADIAKEFDLLIQSHVSENEEEVKEVYRLFSKGYVEVYEHTGLLTDKTILAHGVHLSDSEMRTLKEKGTSISHCPTSNINIKSGLCDVRKLINAGINVGLGTDVSGGHSLSIIEAMRGALDTSKVISFSKPQNGINTDPLNFYDAFYLATLGGAQALGLGKTTGNFQVGKDFDAIIVDMDVKEGGSDLLIECTPLELLQKFIYIGDDRNVISVLIAGKEVKSLVHGCV